MTPKAGVLGRRVSMLCLKILFRVLLLNFNERDGYIFKQRVNEAVYYMSDIIAFLGGGLCYLNTPRKD